MFVQEPDGFLTKRFYILNDIGDLKVFAASVADELKMISVNVKAYKSASIKMH